MGAEATIWAWMLSWTSPCRPRLSPYQPSFLRIQPDSIHFKSNLWPQSWTRLQTGLTSEWLALYTSLFSGSLELRQALFCCTAVLSSLFRDQSICVPGICSSIESGIMLVQDVLPGLWKVPTTHLHDFYKTTPVVIDLSALYS